LRVHGRPATSQDKARRPRQRTSNPLAPAAAITTTSIRACQHLGCRTESLWRRLHPSGYRAGYRLLTRQRADHPILAQRVLCRCRNNTQFRNDSGLTPRSRATCDKVAQTHERAEPPDPATPADSSSEQPFKVLPSTRTIILVSGPPHFPGWLTPAGPVVVGDVRSEAVRSRELRQSNRSRTRTGFRFLHHPHVEITLRWPNQPAFAGSRRRVHIHEFPGGFK
jgi:hypothetical protein